MRGHLLDTHIWYWYISGSERLPAAIRNRLDEQLDACWLSPVSVWELSMLVKKGRLDISTSFRSWTSQAMQMMPVQEAPLNFEVALKSQEIQLSHRDPADHFLAATAVIYDLLLVTVDEHLLGLDWLPAFSG